MTVPPAPPGESKAAIEILVPSRLVTCAELASALERTGAAAAPRVALRSSSGPVDLDSCAAAWLRSRGVEVVELRQPAAPAALSALREAGITVVLAGGGG